MENFQKIAVLIDADNTQLSKLEAMLHEVSTYGRIVVKKAYGNWRKDSLKNWEPELKRLAIRAEQQFDYVTGKNTTDKRTVGTRLAALALNRIYGFKQLKCDAPVLDAATTSADGKKVVLTFRNVEDWCMNGTYKLRFELASADGTYVIVDSKPVAKSNKVELNSDYTWHTGRYTRVAPGGQNEAPAIFKHNGTYWMITSGCTGWDPNEARMFSAPSIFGPWTQHPSPCVGPNAKKTFGGQSTYILTMPDGQHIFMADIWRPKHPIDARYIWLPIDFGQDGKPVIKWPENKQN